MFSNCPDDIVWNLTLSDKKDPINDGWFWSCCWFQTCEDVTFGYLLENVHYYFDILKMLYRFKLFVLYL